MPTVYVTQETDADFSGAEAWGEVQFITKDDLNSTRGSIVNEELLNRIRWLLRRFDPANDWIVIAGSPYVSAAVFMILGHMGIKDVQILRWHNRDRVYRPMFIEASRGMRAYQH